jgi:2-dehydro-3-deoxyglucarate aldolase
MVETGEQLRQIANACRWPPSGSRGVGFSRANLFGKHFEAYSAEAQAPLLVAMIESTRAIDNLEDILGVDGLDAIFIGPYDLSASMGIVAEFDNPEFLSVLALIHASAREQGIASGIHVVEPSKAELIQRIEEGYQFVAYSIDSVFLNSSAAFPL